jgi:hypothetical protein
MPVVKHRLAPVGAIQDVIRRFLEFDACFAGDLHGPIQPSRTYRSPSEIQTDPALHDQFNKQCSIFREQFAAHDQVAVFQNVVGLYGDATGHLNAYLIYRPAGIHAGGSIATLLSN